MPPVESGNSDDQAPLSALDARFRASLHSYFSRRVQGSAEIEDLVQEVFIRLIKRGGVTEMEHVGGYVFQTASSVLNDHLRQRRSRHADAHVEFDPSCHGELEATPEDLLLGRERLARATALLLELPERTRVVFVLRRLEGMRYRDIAGRLGVSVSAVEKHMQHAVAHLTAGLDRKLSNA